MYYWYLERCSLDVAILSRCGGVYDPRVTSDRKPAAVTRAGDFGFAWKGLVNNLHPANKNENINYPNLRIDAKIFVPSATSGNSGKRENS